MIAHRPHPRRLLPVALAGALAALLLVPFARAQDEVDLDAPLPWDPAIEVVGELDNGLDYWVRRHDQPAGKVSLLLHIDSGSLEETEAQRGLAHFLEHMAFNGSENFPPGEVVRFFESMGMRFGQHQNAFTGFDQTSYILSLPDVEEATLEKGLLYFADVAHRLSILPEEVEQERGVILEEKRARSGLQQRMMEELLPRLLPDSRLARRLPIGLESVIREAPAEELRSYYETWYRPDRAALLVVGDVDPATIEPMIREAFADWEAPEETPPAVETGATAIEGLRISVLADPEQNEGDVTLMQVRPRAPMRTAGDLRRALVEDMAFWIVNRRLQRMVQEGTATFDEAGVQAGFAVAGHEIVFAAASGEPGSWASSLRELVAELRLAREQGVDASEVARARGALLAGLEQAAASAAGRDGMAVIMGLNRALNDGRVPVAPADRLALAQALLPTVTPEEVGEALRAAVDPAAGLLLLTVPEGEAPSEEAIAAVHAAAMEAPLGRREATTGPEDVMAERPAPAEVVARLAHEELGATTLVLENGAWMHVRPMPEAEEIVLRINLAGGVCEEDATTRGLTAAAVEALDPGRAATTSLSPADVTTWLESRTVSLGASADATAISLTLQDATVAGLEEGLELAWRLLTEARVDDASLASWRRETLQALESMETDAGAQALPAFEGALCGGDVRLAPPTAERVRAIDRAAAQAWLDRMLREAPIEAAVAGPLSLEEGERIAQVFLGTLPARRDRTAELRALQVVPTVVGPVEHHERVDSVAPLGVVLLGWRGIAGPAEVLPAALTHAGAILSTRLIQEVREARGLTYSVGSGYRRASFENLDALVVQFTAAPEKAEEAAAVAKAVAERLAAEGPTQAEIEAVARQMQNVFSSLRQQPSFWVDSLAGSHARGRELAGLWRRLQGILDVDATAVRQALDLVVADDRYAQVIAGPVPTGDGAAEGEGANEGEPEPEGAASGAR